MENTACSSNRPQWQNPPWVLLAYVVFAFFASIIGFSVFYAPEFHKYIVPVTGWCGLFLYGFSLMRVIMPMFTPGLSCRIDGFLLIVAVAGVADLLMGVFFIPNDFGNPYLRYSPWRPLFTIGIPLLWIVLLRSAPMRQWNERGIQPMQASDQQS